MGIVWLFFPWPLKRWAIEAALCFGGAPSEYQARGLKALHYDYTASLHVALSQMQRAITTQEDLPTEDRDVDMLFDLRQDVRKIKRELVVYGG